MKERGGGIEEGEKNKRERRRRRERRREWRRRREIKKRNKETKRQEREKERESWEVSVVLDMWKYSNPLFIEHKRFSS